MGLRQDQTQTPLPEYEKLRQNAVANANAGADERRQALQRRFASLGNLNSGAQIKQEGILQNDIAKNVQAATNDIDAKEAAERQRRAEVTQGQQFQSGEAEKGRQFASGESALGRQFTAGESALGRTFAGGEAQKGREFTAGESALGRAAQKEQFGQTYDLQNRQFGEQKSQNAINNAANERQFANDQDSQAFNKAQAILASGDREGLESILQQIRQGTYNLNTGQGNNNNTAAMNRKYSVEPGYTSGIKF